MVNFRQKYLYISSDHYNVSNSVDYLNIIHEMPCINKFLSSGDETCDGSD